MDKSTDVNLTAAELTDLLALVHDAIMSDLTREDRKTMWKKLHRGLGRIAMEEINEAAETLGL